MNETMEILEEEYSIHNFSNICRTCLVKGNNKPIFGLMFEEKTVYNLLQLYTSIKIHRSDNLPQTMCCNCLTHLFQMHSFVRKCKQSDVTLHRILNLNSTAGNLIVEEPKLEIANEVDLSSYQDLVFQGVTEFKVEVEVETEQLIKSEKCIDESQSATEGFDELVKTHTEKLQQPEARKLICTVCGKIFRSNKLLEHMRVHTSEKPYECKTCLQCFTWSGNLKRHMMIHTGERQHVCDVCGKGFIQANRLRLHRKTHAKAGCVSNKINGPHLVCNYCGRMFRRLLCYNKHLSRHVSGNADMKIPTQPEIRQHECSECKRSFKNKDHLKTHQLTHGEKSFLCSECGKRFVTKTALQSHIKVHTGEKPHTCSICTKSFAHLSTFQAHVFTHTGQKPYKCNICKKSFTQTAHLKYHMRTHSGERPYVCSYCGKSFAMNGNLTVHIRTHTGETPYLCSFCGKGFYDSSSMKKHKKGHEIVSESLAIEAIDANDSSVDNLLCTK